MDSLEVHETETNSPKQLQAEHAEMVPPPADDSMAVLPPASAALQMIPPPTDTEVPKDTEVAPVEKPPKRKRRKPRKFNFQTVDFARVGQRIAQARRSMGWTQLTLAQRSGTHQGTISQIEAGKRDVKFSLIIRVCKAVGLEFGVYPPVWVQSPKE